jgi:hypothetical protein
MIAFIKNYSLSNIKNKLLLLYILNVTDIIFTLLLVGTGFYMEANALMAKAMQSPSISLAIKIILPALLFITVYFRMQKANDQQLKKSNSLINMATALYVIINVSHILWFTLIPVFINIY